MKGGMEMMTKTEAVEYMTDIMAKFVGYSGKVLPDDVTEKLKELTVPAVRIQEFCSIW